MNGVKHRARIIVDRPYAVGDPTKLVQIKIWETWEYDYEGRNFLSIRNITCRGDQVVRVLQSCQTSIEERDAHVVEGVNHKNTPVLSRLCSLKGGGVLEKIKSVALILIRALCSFACAVIRGLQNFHERFVSNWYSTDHQS